MQLRMSFVEFIITVTNINNQQPKTCN